MIVVSNTSPLAALSGIGQHSLLHALFGEFHIPLTTWTELDAASGLRYRGDLLASDWLVRHEVQNRNLVTPLLQHLGAGEAEAIALAIEMKADLLLMDERLGRRAADRFGLPLLGVVGVLLQAKKRALVPAVRPLLDELRNQVGFHLRASLYSLVLVKSGEEVTPG